MNDDGASGLHAVIHPDGSAVLTVDETPQEIATSAAEDARREIVERAAAIAQLVGHPVPLVVHEPDGTWPLLVHPDGAVESDEGRARRDADPVDDPASAADAPVPVEDADVPGADDDAPDNGDAPEPADDHAEGAGDDIDAIAEAANQWAPTPSPPAADTAFTSSTVTADPTPEDPAIAEAAAQWAPAGTASAPASAAPESAWAPRAAPVIESAPQPVTSDEADPDADADEADADADAVEATVIVDRAPRPVISEPAAPAARDAATPAPTELDADTRDIPTRLPVPAEAPVPASASEVPADAGLPADADTPVSSRHATRHGARPSFLVPERAEEPATQGWRRGLVAIGLRVPPNSAERREREDIAAVSRLWSEPRTIAVVNGKGGSGKTPTAILLAAVFARRGGAGVLAWDNNQTRGTLGWRTERSEHDATLHDLLPETARLLTSEAQSADLARFVHHQARDRFDVLRSKPIALAEEQRMDSEDVSRIHAVAAKYYRLIIMDSGNDESDPMWLRMIDHTDQLVVATTTRGEHAEAGALLLEALAKRDERTAALAHGAVTIVSQADPAASTDEVRRVVDGFGGLARDVATIPYDPAMIGGALRFDNLRPATQRAWLSAGATIARGLDPA
ncbi:MAG: AAA family ATPase [Microbacterium sp.]|uniref:MinD/ParA family ATP-binding protein n=1 Tax=Microbacterium sp. TaxID=51671 RepID=UPI00260CDE48|nr:AAA family ATPase [Microbacterium sp.]MCX6502901.1 AAA family ATPase [Microbacterium sp.]